MGSLGEIGRERLVTARESGGFAGLVDFCQRTRLARRVVENLIMAGAMDGWGLARRKLLWELGQLRYEEEELDLIFPDDGVSLPPLSDLEAMVAEQKILGLSTGDHLMIRYRAWLFQRGILGY